MATTSESNLPALARILLERSTAAYELAAPERKQIHAQEWEEDLENSVLGEVELLDTKIAGMATALIGTGYLHYSPGCTVELLRKSKILSNPKLSAWMTRYMSDSPKYVEYLCALDTLRLFLLEICFDQQET